MGKSSAAPGGGGALPEGSPALRGPVPCLESLPAGCLVLFTLTKSRREGEGHVCGRENPEVEMTETNFARV